MMARSKNRFPTDDETASLSELQKMVAEPFNLDEHEVTRNTTAEKQTSKQQKYRTVT
jgi:hypothetical protein